MTLFVQYPADQLAACAPVSYLHSETSDSLLCRPVPVSQSKETHWSISPQFEKKASLFASKESHAQY